MKEKLKYIIFEATSVCNLNCRYCYNIWKIPGAFIPDFNSYKSALRTLKRLYKIADVGNIAFTGGEPLLSERFTEIVLFARMKKSDVTIISNGNAGSEDMYKTLIGIGASFFEFPLHSHEPDVHDYLTRVRGSHSKVLRSIDFVLNNKGRVVVDLVLNNHNIQQISRTVEYIKSLGIGRLMITRFNIGGEGIKNSLDLMPGIPELRSAFHELDQAAEKFDISITSNVCTPLCVLNPSDYANIRTSSCSASIETMPLTLDINGNTRICNHSPVYFGNIFKDDFHALKNKDYIKSWKTIRPGYCSGCQVYDNCYGGCRAASEQSGLGLDSPDPVIDFL